MKYIYLFTGRGMLPKACTNAARALRILTPDEEGSYLEWEEGADYPGEVKTTDHEVLRRVLRSGKTVTGDTFLIERLEVLR